MHRGEVTIKSFGFNGPPHACEHILSQFHFNKDLIFYIHDPLTGIAELPYAEIAAGDSASTFVILFVGESHGYTEFFQIVDRLMQQCGLPGAHIILYTGCFEDSGPSHNIGTIVPHVTITLSELSLSRDPEFSTPTHHFVNLNRMPTWNRSKLVEALLDADLDRYGKISYSLGVDPDFLGTMPLDHFHFPLKYRSRLPLIVDSPNVDIAQGFQFSHPAISGAMCNVIAESCYDPCVSIPAQFWSTQNPTITEKTFKCFIMGQIPIWLSAKHTVRHVRALGFDVFDDIIDHSYDTELDPERRIFMVAKQVSDFCKKYSESALLDFRTRFGDRFEQNFHTLWQYYFNHDMDTHKWREHFNTLGIIHE